MLRRGLQRLFRGHCARKRANKLREYFQKLAASMKVHWRQANMYCTHVLYHWSPGLRLTPRLRLCCIKIANEKFILQINSIVRVFFARRLAAEKRVTPLPVLALFLFCCGATADTFAGAYGHIFRSHQRTRSVAEIPQGGRHTGCNYHAGISWRFCPDFQQMLIVGR